MANVCFTGNLYRVNLITFEKVCQCGRSYGRRSGPPVKQNNNLGCCHPWENIWNLHQEPLKVHHLLFGQSFPKTEKLWGCSADNFWLAENTQHFLSATCNCRLYSFIWFPILDQEESCGQTHQSRSSRLWVNNQNQQKQSAACNLTDTFIVAVNKSGEAKANAWQ